MQAELSPQPKPYNLPRRTENNSNEFAWPRLLIATLPNFGPVTIAVVALPILVYGVKLGLSRGPNKDRMPKIDCKAFCMQKHPNANHKHTMTAEDFPYKRKLAVADGFNRVVHKLGGFKTYVEARENFYETINKEVYACEKDYFRLVDEDAFRNGWVLMRHQKDFAKALYEVEKGIETIKGAREDLKIKPSRELISLKALLLKELQRVDEYKLELENLSQLATETFTETEQESALEIFSLLAIDENLDVYKPDGLNGLDLLQVWSKELLKNQDQSPLPDEGYPKCYLGQKKGKEHFISFFKALKENYELLIKTNQFQSLPSAALNSSLQKGGMPFLKTFYLDLISFYPPFEEVKDGLKYLYNCAKAELSLSLFLEAQSATDQTKIIDYLLVELPLKEVFIEEKGTIPLSNTEIVVVDTTSQNRRELDQFHESIVKRVKNCKVTFMTVPSKRVYEIFPDKYPFSSFFVHAAETLKQHILNVFKDEKKKRLILISHHKGVEIIQRALRGVPSSQLEKIMSFIFSPSVLVPKMTPKEIYFHSPQDKVTAKVVQHYENFGFVKSLVQILIDQKTNSSKSKISPSKLYHPIYKDKIVELINSLVSNT